MKKKAVKFVVIRVLESTRTRLKIKAAKNKTPIYKVVDALSKASETVDERIYEKSGYGG